MKEQIKKGLDGVKGEVIIAYEPVYSIGTGLIAEKDELNEIIKYIRNNTEHPYKNNFFKKQLPTYIKIEQVVKKFKFNSSNELIKFLQPEIEAEYISIINNSFFPSVELCDNYLRTERVAKIKIIKKSVFVPIIVTLITQMTIYLAKTLLKLLK